VVHWLGFWPQIQTLALSVLHKFTTVRSNWSREELEGCEGKLLSRLSVQERRRWEDFTDPRAWRGVTAAASHRGIVPAIQDLRVRILVSTASIWARKPELSCSVELRAKLRWGCRHRRAAPTRWVSQGSFIREPVARIRSRCTHSCVLIWIVDPQTTAPV
jgi:hypothetical protein